MPRYPSFAVFAVPTGVPYDPVRCHFMFVSDELSGSDLGSLLERAKNELLLAIPVESDRHRQYIVRFANETIQESQIRRQTLFTLSNLLKVKAQRRKRHHYLPVALYFKRFANSRGEIWEYDKRFRSKTIRHIKSAGFQEDLYSIRSPESGELDSSSEIYLEKIERTLEPIIAAIAAQGVQRPFEYFAFLYFAALMFARSPRSIEFARKEVPKFVRAFDDALFRGAVLGQRGIFVPFHKASDGNYIPVGPPIDAFNSVLFCGHLFLKRSMDKSATPSAYLPKDAKVEKAMLRDGLFEAINMWLNSLLKQSVMGEVASCLPGDCFITMDDPASLLFAGKGVRAFPVSSKRCFLFRDQGCAGISSRFSGTLSTAEVLVINRALLEKATHRAYSMDKTAFDNLPP